MNPKRQHAQWGKTVAVDEFILAMMRKHKKNLVVFIWSCFLMKTVRQGLSGNKMLRTQMPALRGGCWLAAHSESLD